MKKKVLAVILATTMVLGLVACGAKEEAAPAAEAPAETVAAEAAPAAETAAPETPAAE